MGDLIEITTVPNQQEIFYRVTSGAISFYVRGPGNAEIGLAKKPEKACCDILICLGSRGSTWISENKVKVVTVPTPNIVSGGEFKGFWLQWHDDMICLGREHERKALISYKPKSNTYDMKYISFSVHKQGHSGHSLQWKFELPPLRDKPKIKPLSGGLPQWVQADTQLPDGALIGGFEKEALYIIRAKHRGSLTPGKFVPSEGVGYIPWGGAANEKNEFEVLCGYNCVWIPSSNGAVPLGAVEAGHSEGSERETLFVGRSMCNNELIPGKVQPSHKVCYIPYNDREIARKVYEVLVVPDKNAQCLNPFFPYMTSINDFCQNPTPTEENDYESNHYDVDGMEYEEEEDE